MTETKQSSFSYEDVLKIAKGELFEHGAPKLPRPPMLMFDRITTVNDTGGKYGKGVIEAELDINPDMWFFDCHFMDDPVMPGCLGLDAMWQLTGFFLAWMGLKGKGRALGVKEVRFTGQVLPTARKVRYFIDIKRVLNLKLAMIIADGRMEVDGEEIYTADDMRVGLFN